MAPQLRRYLCILIKAEIALLGDFSASHLSLSLSHPSKKREGNEAFGSCLNTKLLKLISPENQVIFRYGSQCMKIRKQASPCCGISTKAYSFHSAVHSECDGVEHSASIPIHPDSSKLFSWVILVHCVH